MTLPSLQGSTPQNLAPSAQESNNGPVLQSQPASSLLQGNADQANTIQVVGSSPGIKGQITTAMDRNFSLFFIGVVILAALIYWNFLRKK